MHNIDIEMLAGDLKFSVRCSAFVKNEADMFLVQKKKSDPNDSWALPGGKLKIRESINLCIRRELHEEFNLSIKEVKYLGLIQQYVKIGDMKRHELNFVNLIENFENFYLKDHTLNFKWVERSELKQIKPKKSVNLLELKTHLETNWFLND